MNLVEEADSSHVNQVDIHTGSGNFLIDGAEGRREKTVQIFYHTPKNFGRQSEILLVIPGSGRNAWDYRDAWVEASEKYNVLILSPKYSEDEYSFGGYHMGGLMYDINLEESANFVDGSNEVILSEETFRYKINADTEEWIFNDFDRLFDMVVDNTEISRSKYDIFGHSAGGQILHRFTLLYPNSKADRIVAANSGFYTLPDFRSRPPFGLKDTPVARKDLVDSFEKNLTVYIGENDDESETGGILLRSPSADEQGMHRLERGKYFYKRAQSVADELDAAFNWKLKIVPDVGHDSRGMSEAAAKYLYEGNRYHVRILKEQTPTGAGEPRLTPQ